MADSLFLVVDLRQAKGPCPRQSIVAVDNRLRRQHHCERKNKKKTCWPEARDRSDRIPLALPTVQGEAQ